MRTPLIQPDTAEQSVAQDPACAHVAMAKEKPQQVVVFPYQIHIQVFNATKKKCVIDPMHGSVALW